ncbi:hypothetical protein EOM39_04275 [Candidatus Gracilibacteria bacterium]|nr:hypothetical protein [Candidatus Gracilibacteria bacterium]
MQNPNLGNVPETEEGELTTPQLIMSDLMKLDKLMGTINDAKDTIEGLDLDGLKELDELIGRLDRPDLFMNIAQVVKNIQAVIKVELQKKEIKGQAGEIIE